MPVLSSQPDACTFAERCPAADHAVPVRGTAADARAAAAGIRRSARPAQDHLAACWHPVGAPGTRGHRLPAADETASIR